MRAYHLENLSHDAVHGYIPFCSAAELSEGETSEREIIDHPWVQRLRHIHQPVSYTHLTLPTRDLV